MQRYKIVMLPTQKADLPNGIVKYLPTGELSYSKYPVYACDINEKWEQQHLYIVGTEADFDSIKYDQWCYDTETTLLFQYKYNARSVKSTAVVIASTDTSFGLSAITQDLIDGVIKHGIDNIVIKRCYYTGDVLTVHWTDKLKEAFNSLSETVKDIRVGVLNPVHNTEETQVDFDLLQKFNDYIHNSMLASLPMLHKEIANHKLFFELEEVKRIINK